MVTNARPAGAVGVVQRSRRLRISPILARSVAFRRITPGLRECTTDRPPKGLKAAPQSEHSKSQAGNAYPERAVPGRPFLKDFQKSLAWPSRSRRRGRIAVQ